MMHRLVDIVLCSITFLFTVGIGVTAAQKYMTFAAQNGENGTVYGSLLGIAVFGIFGSLVLFLLAPVWDKKER